MKVLSVVGARPQFIKAAPVCRALRAAHEEVLVHSGQHYDYEMSDAFFERLGITKPDFNLAVGAGSRGRQTGEMIGALEELFIEQCPDVVLVYGDTDTTLAAGLAAAKAHVPVAHVEAGMRAYDRMVPEELNRVLVDHLSEVLFCATRSAVNNLAAEGISHGVHLVGDVMLDTARFFSEDTDGAEELSQFGVAAGEYYLATVQRGGTSDSRSRLESVIRAFGRLGKSVVWALHPRTRKNIEAFGLDAALAAASNVRVVPPVSYAESVALLKNASALLTDSGGMQKEAYFFGVPCVTLRDETEWIETVESGWNRLAGTDEATIVEAVEGITVPTSRPDVYGDGQAAAAIVSALEAHFDARSAASVVE